MRAQPWATWEEHPSGEQCDLPPSGRVGYGLSEGQRIPSPKRGLSPASFMASRAKFLNDAMSELQGKKRDIHELDFSVVPWACPLSPRQCG